MNTGVWAQKLYRGLVREPLSWTEVLSIFDAVFGADARPLKPFPESLDNIHASWVDAKDFVHTPVSLDEVREAYETHLTSRIEISGFRGDDRSGTFAYQPGHPPRFELRIRISPEQAEQVLDLLQALGKLQIVSGDPAVNRMNHPLFGTYGTVVDRTLCFVLMPFDARFDEIWQDVILKVCEEHSLKCIRADNIYGPGSIIQDIWAKITSARVLIAELTGKNPNVFYELGLAHAQQKDVILLSQTLDDVPFDLRHLRVIVYGTTPRQVKKLHEDISANLVAVLA